MNRSTFLLQLRTGLSGLPEADADDIIRDYESHFADGDTAGRSEEDIAAGLGDPLRLAKELRAEFSLKQLEKKRSPLNIAAALLALGGLATIDVLLLLPLALVVGILVLAVGVALVAVSVAGTFQFASLLWDTFSGAAEVTARVLDGIGLMAAAISGTAFLLIGLEAAARSLGRYARLHYRLLQQTDAQEARP